MVPGGPRSGQGSRPARGARPGVPNGMQGGITCQANLCTGSIKGLEFEASGVWTSVDERPLTPVFAWPAPLGGGQVTGACAQPGFSLARTLDQVANTKLPERAAAE